MQLNESAGAGESLDVGLAMNATIRCNQDAPPFIYNVECRDASGKLKWREIVENLVTTAGKTDIVDKYFKGSAYTAAFYLMLKGTGTAAAGDTMSSHAGWSEVTPYSGNRPAITFGTTSGGSNTATAVVYTINATATVAGAAVCTTNTGTSGTLYSAADFAASRGVASGDTLTVTPTLSVS
jgi:hypothetical protein